jgi:hypothetical protein
VRQMVSFSKRHWMRVRPSSVLVPRYFEWRRNTAFAVYRRPSGLFEFSRPVGFRNLDAKPRSPVSFGRVAHRKRPRLRTAFPTRRCWGGATSTANRRQGRVAVCFFGWRCLESRVWRPWRRGGSRATSWFRTPGTGLWTQREGRRSCKTTGAPDAGLRSVLAGWQLCSALRKCPARGGRGRGT